MRKSKYSEHQIIAILKAVEVGRTVKDVCREHELMSDALWGDRRAFRTFNLVDDFNREVLAIEVDFNLARSARGAHAGQWPRTGAFDAG